MWLVILFGVPLAVALGVGVWLGIGGPGLPAKPISRKQRLQRRPINPIAFGNRPRRR